MQFFISVIYCYKGLWLLLESTWIGISKIELILVYIQTYILKPQAKHMYNQDITVNVRFQNQVYPFCFPDSATIRDLKSQIYNELQIQPQCQSLQFDGNYIGDEDIELIYLSDGGSLQILVGKMEERDFPFNNLTEKVKRSVHKSTNPRSCRRIRPGLVTLAKCKNNACDAYKKNVCINYGFGSFELGQLLFSGLGPLYSKNTERVFNFGYYKTTIIINGIKSEGDLYQFSECADDGQFHTFKQENGVETWSSVDITTIPLD